jgi:hypothetical protein
MVKISIWCDNCEKAVAVKEFYLSHDGYIEMVLRCGCKLFLGGIKRIPQVKEGG